MTFGDFSADATFFFFLVLFLFFCCSYVSSVHCMFLFYLKTRIIMSKNVSSTMIGFHHPSIHLVQVRCKKLMIITLRYCVAYAEKRLILVIGNQALLSHEQSENHKKNVESMKVQPPMNAIFKKSENSAKGSSENQSSSNAASSSNKQ